jgi:hypothetical protein
MNVDRTGLVAEKDGTDGRISWHESGIGVYFLVSLADKEVLWRA